ncbi:hypothetical protein P0136_04435 [Lentisphaerota bacterium ZTH]|nr:hypothetical protein JYG24_04445 [Lentisphaerota bacterium]WET07242.1 hypothetical protein P0136_04435 [Lentisphaerota bacterium ZTH]
MGISLLSQISTLKWILIGAVPITLVVLIIAIVFLVKKFKKKKPKKEESALKIFFKPNKYKRYLRQFKNHLPMKVKMSIYNRKQFLYINAANDELIRQSTDVDAYSYQYFPNYRTDKECNFYVSGKSFFTELKKEAILDNSSLNNRKLAAFIKKFYQHQRPVVVVSIDHRQLQTKLNEKDLELELAIRKKLNLVSQVFKSPVRVHICISGLDSSSGFEPLCEFIKDSGLSYHIKGSDISKLTTELKAQLEEYSTHISRLLINNSNMLEAASAVSCISMIDKMSSKINNWLQKLTFDDGILSPPRVKSLLLSTYNYRISPFQALYSKPKLNYRRRNIIFGIIGILFLILLGNSATKSYNIIKMGFKNTETLGNEAKMASSNFELSQKAIKKSISMLQTTRINLHKSLWTIPYANSIVTTPIKNQIADITYKYIFLPELTRTNNPEQALFYVFLTQSEASNSLKNFLKKNTTKWASELKIDQEIIKAYLDFNTKIRSGGLKGADVYPKTSSYSFGDQHRYLLNLYANLSNKNNITLRDVNNFLRYYYSYYNKKITIDILLNRFYGQLEPQLPTATNKFVREYRDYLNTNMVKDNDSDELIKNIDVFDKVSYKVPKNLSFTKLLRTLENIVNNASSLDHSKTLLVASPVRPLMKKNWKQIVAVAKVNTLLDNYYSMPESKSGLFSEKSKELFMPIILNQDNNGRFMFTGKYQVPGTYTKLALESAVQPLYNQFNQLIPKLNRLGVNTRMLEYKFSRNLKDYVSNYLESYVKLTNSFSYSVSSPVQLDMFLNTLSSPHSPLLELVNTINENTQMKINKQNRFMAPVVNKFKPFSMLLAEGKDKKNTIGESNIEVYFNVLQQVMGEVATKSASDEKSPEFVMLRKRLSKLGVIAMNIALNKKDSYLKIVESWLDNINMPNDLRGPFIKPIVRIYKFGSRDLKTKLSQVWNDEMLPLVNSSRKEFPFKNNAMLIASTDELTTSFSPDGSFWNTFNNYFKPLLRYEGGKWTAKAIPYSKSVVDPNELACINRVYKMTQALWDKNSNPKPLLIKVSPMNIEKVNGYDGIINMTYLNSGNSSVIGINSAPIWKEIKINWWQEDISETGIQLTDGSNFNKAEPQGTFSFYRLLRSAKYDSKNNSYSWKINFVGNKSVHALVSFKVRGNPWAIFAI